MTSEFDENDAIPAGVEVKGMTDPDGNPARGRWIKSGHNSMPISLMVERFIDKEPVASEWDIWIEAKEGVGEAEKLNAKPYKAATFFEAVSEYMWKDKQLAQPVGPDRQKARTLLHTQGGIWHMKSWDHPEDSMGRRLWPTEDQARGFKIWDLWVEGTEVDGVREPAAKLNDTHIVADSFDEAVRKYIADLDVSEAVHYSKDTEQNVWLREGRKLHPTEGRARVLFG